MDNIIKNDENICIGANIREERLRRNIGQTQLVRLLQLQGVSITRESLVTIERGSQHVKASQLKAIKECLKVNYDDLIR